jgi:hypothetical protein
MGDKTYATFQSDLTFYLGNRGDISAYVGGWINTAYRDLATRDMFWSMSLPSGFIFPQLATSASSNTTDGVAYVAMPTDAFVLNTIHDATNDRKLESIPFKEYIEKANRADTDSEGKPQHWTRRGTSIFLYPTPDATYSLTVYYRKVPAAMSGGTDVTVLGAEWDEPILKLAVIQSLMRLGEYDKANYEKADWQESVAARVGAYLRNETDRKTYLIPDPATMNFEYGD